MHTLMTNRRPSVVLLAVALAVGASGCSAINTSDPSCAYAGLVPGLTISAIDSVTQQPPTAVPVISATASDGKVTKSTGSVADGDSVQVSVYVGPGTYTITITTPGYKTINGVLVSIPQGSDLSCAEPYTEFLSVELVPIGAP